MYPPDARNEAIMTPTLFATTTTPPRFFLVPSDLKLIAGPLAIRDLRGNTHSVDPVVIDVFEVTETEAKAHAARVMRGLADHAPKWTRILNDITAAVHEAQQDLDAATTREEDLDAAKARMADAIGLPGQDWDAAEGEVIVDHLKEAFQRVGAVARDAIRGTPEGQRDAEARMRQFAHDLGGGRDPAGAEALGDTLTALTGAVRTALEDPDLQLKVEALTAQLKEAAEETRRATEAARAARGKTS